MGMHLTQLNFSGLYRNNRGERIKPYSYNVSWNLTGLPIGSAAISPSRITTLPRIIVPIGQPIISIPSKGDHPHFETNQSALI